MSRRPSSPTLTFNVLRNSILYRSSRQSSYGLLASSRGNASRLSTLLQVPVELVVLVAQVVPVALVGPMALAVLVELMALELVVLEELMALTDLEQTELVVPVALVQQQDLSP